jgi:hypothetical protein
MGMVYAASLLIVVSGCSASSFFLSYISSGGKSQVVSGSVDDVSAHLQAALNNVGITVAATPDGDDLRLAGVTKSGKRFVLLLKRQKTSSGENTAISIDWEKDADEEFWLSVVEIVAKRRPAAQNAFSSANAVRPRPTADAR